MKKILILGLLLVSHLWGLKEVRRSICLSEMCFKDNGNPTLPNDYKPTKEDRIMKIKVENAEGVILDVAGNAFIKGNNEKFYRYIDGLNLSPKAFLITYPHYSVLVNFGVLGIWANFYQIFRTNALIIFKIGEFGELLPTLSCDSKDNTLPCPLTRQSILDWIKKQGGQEFFDYACPAYYDKLNSVCSEGVLREPTCQEAKGINPYVDGCED